METADLTHHISRRFNEDLEKVRNQVLSAAASWRSGRRLPEICA